MCKCTPSVRTPYCGKLGCQWPKDEDIRPTRPQTDCWTGLSDEEMAERDPELAAEIIKRRNALIEKFKKEKSQKESSHGESFTEAQ